ncbi:uncharacterized protein LOC117252016 [Epinephelus lanceolatus]|uniref:uncharacterized protein LOC117252016 isoform X2 n=1 Tax=Epinephelus lanceolatus TaxID=310571 RepID=UPI0014475B20|nr:uncharacterized protein LOC117252016 isoform X2 [Epinephelus lanceolatus]
MQLKIMAAMGDLLMMTTTIQTARPQLQLQFRNKSSSFSSSKAPATVQEQVLCPSPLQKDFTDDDDIDGGESEDEENPAADRALDEDAPDEMNDESMDK